MAKYTMAILFLYLYVATVFSIVVGSIGIAALLLPWTIGTYLLMWEDFKRK